MKPKELDFYEKHPTIKDVYLSYKYNDNTSKWDFIGYRCTLCNQTFKRETTFPEHQDRCKYKKLADNMREAEITILNLTNSTSPIDFNQN